jgi:hypothetical protein
LINKDVPQHVIQKLLDHDSAEMTAHYARLSDATVRRHWEAARKVNHRGEQVQVDPAGPLADAAWAKHRLGHATQVLPNGYCGLPLVKTCQYANACLTCPLFITTAEFLPQHPHPAPADPADHRHRPPEGADPDGRDEPAGRRQPPEDHHGVGGRGLGPGQGGGWAGAGGGRGCVLTTVRPSWRQPVDVTR